jgi:large subunit ribosomal protein L30
MAEAAKKKAPAKKAGAKKSAAKKTAPKKAAAKKSTVTKKAPAPKKAAASKKAAGSKAGGRLRVTQVRSLSGRPANHRATMEALGFRWHQQTLVKDDNPSIRGMLFQVRHLVKVEEVAGGKA